MIPTLSNSFVTFLEQQENYPTDLDGMQVEGFNTSSK
jgi:hypothetical protein